MSAPIRWSNPPGAGPALFDPENNPAGIEHAVIDTRDSDTNLNLTSLTLSDMTISGPPAFDGSSFATHRGSSSARPTPHPPVRRRAGHGLWSGPTTRHWLDRKLELAGRADRALRWAMENHWQPGTGLDGPDLLSQAPSRSIRRTT